MGIVFYEGAYLPEEEAKIPITDRGFLFGDGVYTTIQVRDGIPLFLHQHLERLKKQCLSFNLIPTEIHGATIYELIALNQATAGVFWLKILVTGGDLPEHHLPKRQGRILITLRPFVVPKRVPLKCGVFPHSYALCHASFKSLASLNRYYMMQWAHENGYDDCVAHTEKGYLLEAAFGNLFWIEGKTLFTPSPELPLYFGVTLTNVLKVAESLGYKIHYVEKPIDQLSESCCYFRTNTMRGIRPFAEIGPMKVAYDETLDKKFCVGYEELILKSGQELAALGDCR